MNTTHRITPALVLLTLTRLVVNTGHRLVSPFLPVIARGIGIPLEQAGTLVAARSAAQMATPLIVGVSRRYDRRSVIQLGLAMFVLGSAVTAMLGTFSGVAAGFVLMGLGKAVFDVSGQAYLSDRTPYERRARALAIFEMTWAGGFLVGAPAVGWMIAWKGWESAYLAIAIVLAVVLFATVRPLEADHTDMGERGRLSLDRSARWLLVVVALFSFGSEMVAVVLGAWLEDDLAFAIGAIAGLAALIGVAELVGASSTAAFTDRLGKRRSVAIGLIVGAVGYSGLALSAGAVAFGVVAALVTFAGFEFTIVSTFPLASEAVDGARARYLAWVVVAVGIGRTIASYSGTRVFTSIGFEANATLAIVANLLALAILLVMVAEPVGRPISASRDDR